MSERAKWFELISKWEQSNETQKRFCAERNISYKRFTKWRTIYKKRSEAQIPNQAEFKQLQIVSPTEPSQKKVAGSKLIHLKVHCPNGYSVSMTEPQSLTEVMRIVKQLSEV